MDRRRFGKKIFFLMLACIFGISMVGYAVYATKNTDSEASDSEKISSQEAKTTELVSLALKESSEKDDDNDSLLNWEEVLWGTDPKKADSDSDGTKDGEEVALGRNPVVAGPKDELADSRVGTAAAINGTKSNKQTLTAEDKTETARVSQELFANYISAKQTGAAIDANVQAQIIKQTFSNESFGTTYKKYTRGDVKVKAVSADIEDDLKKYGNDLGAAFYAGQIAGTSIESEIEIVHKALTTDKPADLKKLDPIIASHKRILTALTNVSVPSTMISTHLEILNSLSRIVANSEGLKMIFTDPLIGVTAVSHYYKDLQSFQNILSQLVSEFDENGVFFDETEKGYLLVKNT